MEKLVNLEIIKDTSKNNFPIHTITNYVEKNNIIIVEWRSFAKLPI